MEQGHRPNDWLGLLLEVRLWFYDSVLASEAAFERKVDKLCRELGKRGEA